MKLQDRGGAGSSSYKPSGSRIIGNVTPSYAHPAVGCGRKPKSTFQKAWSRKQFKTVDEARDTSGNRLISAWAKLQNHRDRNCHDAKLRRTFDAVTGLDCVNGPVIRRAMRGELPKLITLSHASRLDARLVLLFGMGEIAREALADGRMLRTFSTINGASRTDFYAPRLNLGKARRTQANVAKDIGFDGLCIYEPEKIRGGVMPKGDRAIESTFHGFGWIPEEGRKRTKKLAEHSRRLVSYEGFRTIDYRPVGRSEAQAVGWGEYGSKLPCAEKNLAPAKRGKRPFTVYRNKLGPESTVRMFELLSYLSIRELILARGASGKALKRQLFDRLGPLAEKRPPPLFDELELRRFWSGYWRACGNRRFADNPVVVAR